MSETPDGKIRIRCTGCGKRVKFPKGIGGQAYRCPVCHKTIITPLDGANPAMPTTTELKSAIASPSKTPASPLRAPNGSVPTRISIPEKSPEDSNQNLDTIERIASFVSRQTMTTAQEAREILEDPTLDEKEIVAELRQLRHDRAVRLNKFTQAVRETLDTEIKKLESSPAAETESIRNRLEPLLEEREALRLYIGTMFTLRTLSGKPAAAKTDTPAGASEPPSKPSPQAPEKP